MAELDPWDGSDEATLAVLRAALEGLSDAATPQEVLSALEDAARRLTGKDKSLPGSYATVLARAARDTRVPVLERRDVEAALGELEEEAR